MGKRIFHVIIEKDENGALIAKVPALHGCHTQARDIATLRLRIREAIELCLEFQECLKD